jgi:hypothetical protein
MLKVRHVDGLRLRQQSNVGSTVDGVTTKEWKFEPEECRQDEDSRLVGADGKKVKLGTYTVYLTAGVRNLVIEKKGKVESYDLKNSALRNQMRVQYQKLQPVTKDGKPAKTKEGKTIMEWKNDGPAQYTPPNTVGGAFVGDGQRVIVDEMPT